MVGNQHTPVAHASRRSLRSLLSMRYCGGPYFIDSAFVGEALVALHAHGDAHAAADAERGQALLGVALLHLVEQRGEHARARGADRVTERDRAAIDVELGRVEAQFLADR